MDPLKSSIDYYDNNVEKYLAFTEGMDMKPYIDGFLHGLQGKKVLDLACGPGRDMMHMRSREYSVTGADLSMGLLAVARTRGPVAQMDMRSLGYKNESFDGVYCASGLIHLTKADSRLALQEMNRVLKPGGALYMSILQGEGEQKPRKERSYTYFTGDEISNMLSSTDFAVPILIPPENSPFMSVLARKLL